MFKILFFWFVLLLPRKKSGGERQADHGTQRRLLSVLLVTAFAGHLLPCLALGEALVKRVVLAVYACLTSLRHLQR